MDSIEEARSYGELTACAMDNDQNLHETDHFLQAPAVLFEVGII